MKTPIRLLFLLLSTLGLAALSGCGPEQCFYVPQCVESCGGPAVTGTCDGCPEGRFDDMMCMTDGAASCVQPTSSGDRVPCGESTPCCDGYTCNGGICTGCPGADRPCVEGG